MRRECQHTICFLHPTRTQRHNKVEFSRSNFVMLTFGFNVLAE